MRTIPLILALALTTACGQYSDGDKDGFTADVDCDDSNAAINPDAAEICDGIDNNCDDAIDGEDAAEAKTFYADSDGDGFGGQALYVTACEAPAGYLEDNSDCNDLNAASNPTATEICDGEDNDCDAQIDDADDSLDASTGTTFFEDNDADGYGSDATTQACTLPAGYSTVDGDCDDTNADINPDLIWYADVDGDGYGAVFFTVASCERPDGYTDDNTDCDDLAAAVNPAATEICDGLDNNCNEEIDDADAGVDPTTFNTWYVDSDIDGYGNVEVSIAACAAPDGYVADATDCDDDAVEVNPGETEVCNDGLDNDCSGDAPLCGITAGTYGTTDVDYTLDGANSSDYLGRSVAMLDFDGDGDMDLAAGAYGNDDGDTTAGQVYVWYDVTADGTAGTDSDASWYGEEYNNYLGYSVANAGDVDGDGTDDLIMGGYSVNSWRGGAYLVYGSTTAFSGSSSSDDASASWVGVSGSDYVGHAVAGFGDTDGDGYADIGIGSYGDDDGGSSSGSVWLVYGSSTQASGESNVTDADAQFYGSTSSSYLGYYTSMDGVGDLDGDGYDDFVLGAYYRPNGYYGAAYVMYGSSTRFAGSADVADAADANIAGSGIYDYFGRTVTRAGDVNDDGYDEFMVWEYYGGSDNGAVFIFEGGSTQLSGDYDASTDAYATLTGNSTYDYFGRAMATGDFNNDGSIDLLIGAGGNDDGGSTAGATYVYYGPVATGTYTASDADIDIYGDTSSEYLGYYGVASGDIDDDGVDDIIMGAYGANSSAGEVLVWIGGGM